MNVAHLGGGGVAGLTGGRGPLGLADTGVASGKGCSLDVGVGVRLGWGAAARRDTVGGFFLRLFAD